MLDPVRGIPEVAHEELLARYVLHSSHIRRHDQTIKPDAFIPHPHGELSVTRHVTATEEELWGVGEAVAQRRNRTLYGRADLRAANCADQRLRVQAALLPDNPNHANIVGWPAEKSEQKAIALQLAANAVLVARGHAL